MSGNDTASLFFDHPTSQPQNAACAPAAPVQPAPASQQPTKPDAPAEPPSEPESRQEVDDRPSASEVLFDGGSALTAAAADSVLAAGFDSLEYQARYDQNAEDQQALVEGRKIAAETMAEMGVGESTAREVVGSLSEWYARPALDDAALEAAGVRAEAELRREWGSRYAEMVGHAQRTYQAAVAKMPWLADIVESGAGQDPRVIREFARIGERQARTRLVVARSGGRRG